MKTKPLYLTLAALVMATALTACNREQSSEAQAEYGEMKNNASENYDEAKANASASYDQAKSEVREGYNDASATMGDAAITAKVKSSIIAEPDIEAMNINVDTVNGVVTLRGTVHSSAESDRVEEIARTTEGVKSVDNKLDIQA
jgi:hyperosmotically inducible periplasmic protein